MKNLFRIVALLGLLAIGGCGNDQEERDEDSIRDSIRRQDSLNATDRLNRLQRQVGETIRKDSIIDSTAVIETN